MQHILCEILTLQPLAVRKWWENNASCNILLFLFLFVFSSPLLCFDFFFSFEFVFSSLVNSCLEDCSFESLWPKKSTASATLSSTSGLPSSLSYRSKPLAIHPWLFISVYTQSTVTYGQKNTKNTHSESSLCFRTYLESLKTILKPFLVEFCSKT